MSKWVETTLGEVAEWGSGSTPKATDPANYGGAFPWATIGDLRDGPLTTTSSLLSEVGAGLAGKVVPVGATLISMYGTIGRTAIARVPMYTNQAIAWGKPHPEKCRDEFLLLLAQALAPRLNALGRGATQRNVNRQMVKEQGVVLPPLAEQRRIVDVMAAVDAQIESLAEELAANMGALGPMTDGMLAGDAEWPMTPLGEVGEFQRGKRFTKAEYTDGGLGVIHYAHIHTHLGPIATEPVAHVSEACRSRLRLAAPGDVVIAATSEDMAGVGKATAWMGLDDVAVHDDAQIYRHDLDPCFASFLFASPAFQRQKVQYAGGTKVTRISGTDLAKIEVPMPPRDVQQRIGAALAEVAMQSDCVAKELARLRMFRSTLLTALLNQEIEIPESYDALLEATA